MLIPIAILRRIEAGEVDLQFRRWTRPTVKTGGTLTTRIGVLSIDSVEKTPVAKITADDARRAGHDTVKDLKRFLARKQQGDVYRVQLHVQGPDPRIALRNNATLTDADRADLDAKLARLPWARPYLETIAKHPATLALDLAQMHGTEKRPFKQRVRRLKELGLTESLEVGYRLSPRGESYLNSD